MTYLRRVTNDEGELRSLSTALLTVTSRAGGAEVLQVIVDTARALVGAQYAALGLPAESGGFAEFFTSGISEEQQRRIGPMPRAHGLLGKLLEAVEPYRTDDVRQLPEYSWWPAAHPTLGPFLAAPIVDQGAVLGVVYVAKELGATPFGIRDEQRLEILAAHAAIALTRARLSERERELAMLEERARIARDLHDAVSQRLFSLRLTIGAADALASRGESDKLRAELTTATELAGAALEELRAVVAELRPPALREDGLAAALRKHLGMIGRAYRVNVRFDCVGECREQLTDVSEEAVFRIAQEAVHNAVRHGGPENVTVRLESDHAGVRLMVQDDGAGFESGAYHPGAGDGRHLGITSMRERARELGGRVTVQPGADGQGATVRLEVPR